MMRIYDELTAEYFYWSIYTKRRLLSNGIHIIHKMTSQEVILDLSTDKAAFVWKMFENGASRDEIVRFFSDLSCDGKAMFVHLLARGIIE